MEELPPLAMDSNSGWLGHTTLTHCLISLFWTFPNSKEKQTSNYFRKLGYFSWTEWKTLWQKRQSLITSDCFICHNVFKYRLLQVQGNAILWGKGLINNFLAPLILWSFFLFGRLVDWWENWLFFKKNNVTEEVINYQECLLLTPFYIQWLLLQLVDIQQRAAQLEHLTAN